MNTFALFIHRRMADDMELHIIECNTCIWHTFYNQVLWTSNDRPDGEATAFQEVSMHARAAHRSPARIIRGWRP